MHLIFELYTRKVRLRKSIRSLSDIEEIRSEINFNGRLPYN